MKKFKHVREGFNADGTKQEINSPPVHDYGQPNDGLTLARQIQERQLEADRDDRLAAVRQMRPGLSHEQLMHEWYGPKKSEPAIIAPHNHSMGVYCDDTCPRWLEVRADQLRQRLIEEVPDLDLDKNDTENLPLNERDGNLGEVIDRRVQVYGDPVVAFAEIAEMWTTYLGFPVQAHQVPIMQLLMKVVRSKTSPDYSDHSDDIEGYLDIFRKIIGSDMIQARSVSEYIEQKWPGES